MENAFLDIPRANKWQINHFTFQNKPIKYVEMTISL